MVIFACMPLNRNSLRHRIPFKRKKIANTGKIGHGRDELKDKKNPSGV